MGYMLRFEYACVQYQESARGYATMTPRRHMPDTNFACRKKSQNACCGKPQHAFGACCGTRGLATLCAPAKERDTYLEP